MKLSRIYPSEAQEQKTFIDYINFIPSLKGCAIKIHNEGKRSPFVGKMLKSQGLLPGASDIFIAKPSGHYHGMFLEMKRNSACKPRITQNQIDFIENMASKGYFSVIAYGCDDAIRLLKLYLQS